MTATTTSDVAPSPVAGRLPGEGLREWIERVTRQRKAAQPQANEQPVKPRRLTTIRQMAGAPVDDKPPLVRGTSCSPATPGRVTTGGVPAPAQSTTQSGAIPDGPADGFGTAEMGCLGCDGVLHVYVRNVETPTEPMTCDDSGIVNDTRSGCQSGIDTPIQGV